MYLEISLTAVITFWDSRAVFSCLSEICGVPICPVTLRGFCDAPNAMGGAPSNITTGGSVDALREIKSRVRPPNPGCTREVSVLPPLLFGFFVTAAFAATTPPFRLLDI